MKKQLTTFLLAGLIVAGTLTGCAQKGIEQNPSAEASAPGASDKTEQETSSVAGRTDQETSPTASEEKTITLTDDLGREVTIEHADRTAVLIGSFADIWCLAGGADSLVATADDAWTSFDLNLSEDVIHLGAVKDPDREVLLAAEPDLVIASCNTQADLDLMPLLEDAGIPALYFEVSGFEDYLRMLKACTEITGRSDLYAEHGLRVKDQIEAVNERVRKSRESAPEEEAPTVLYIRVSGTSAKIKGSSGNVLGEMLADLGCVNVADSDTSLLEDLSLEAVLAADPDYIFAVYQSADQSKADAVIKEALLDQPVWSSLRAVQDEHFYLMEHALYNLKPNARWGEAYEKLAEIICPEN